MYITKMTQFNRLFIFLEILTLLGFLTLPGKAQNNQISAVTTIDDRCQQSMDPGPCRMSLERFYFNYKTNACETFKFGGCRGNNNRFGFRRTCEEACMPLSINTRTSARPVISTPKTSESRSSSKPSRTTMNPIKRAN